MSGRPRKAVLASLCLVALLIALAVIALQAPRFFSSGASQESVPAQSNSVPAAHSNGPPPDRLSIPTAEDIADAISRQLVEGQILYEPSREMEVHKPATVMVRVSADPQFDVRKDLKESGYAVERVRVSYRTKAVLEGPIGFATITPLGGLPDGVQVLGRSGYTSWNWSVTPLKAEDFGLKLYLYAVVTVGNDSAPHLLLTKEAKINVRTSTIASMILNETGSLAGKFYDKIPELLASGTGSGVAIALLAWRRKRRKKDPPKMIVIGAR